MSEVKKAWGAFAAMAARPIFQDSKGNPATPPKSERIVKDGEAKVQTGPIDGSITAVDDYLREAGFDPLHWMLKPGTGIRRTDWTALRRSDGETIVEPMQSVRLEVVQRPEQVDMEELLTIVGTRAPAPPALAGGDDTFTFMWSDLQLSKRENGSIEGHLHMFMDIVAQAVARFKKSGRSKVFIAALGDACEGNQSQGGTLMWRTALTITEQVRVLRRLYLEIIDAFVDARASSIKFATVSSNHGQAQRAPVTTLGSDDWGVEALVAVQDAIKMNPSRYEHVEIFTPARDEENVILEVAGTTVALSHGHRFFKMGNLKKSVFDWWQRNLFNGTPEGEAKVLLLGHAHHLNISEEGGKTFIIAPALERESTWFRLAGGVAGDPGALTFELDGPHIKNLTRLRPAVGV